MRRTRLLPPGCGAWVQVCGHTRLPALSILESLVRGGAAAYGRWHHAWDGNSLARLGSGRKEEKQLYAYLRYLDELDRPRGEER